MNAKRYTPEIDFYGEWVYAIMAEDKRGEFVKVEDYKHLMGVVRNLRTKLAKKDRRNRKFKQEGV